MKTKRKPKPFDAKLSLQLDQAIRAEESGDKARRLLGKIWRKQIEKKIWGKNELL